MRLIHAMVLVPAVSFGATSAFLLFPQFELSRPAVAVEQSAVETVIDERKEATLVFVGDIMLDRSIRSAIAARGADQVFGGMADFLKHADLTAGNLEGPITDNASVSQGTQVGDAGNMHFTFPSDSATMLKSYGFDLLSMGNNHIMDFGADGARSTVAALRSAGLSYVGDPTGESTEPIIIDVKGITVGVVSFNDFAYRDPVRTEREIQLARQKADVVVVMTHWGEEYKVEPPAYVRELAKTFAASGADMIIGTHPHVAGLRESIGGTRVYYSLGNFVFDQYWEAGVRCGLAVEAHIIKEHRRVQITYNETKIGMHKDGATVVGCE